MRGTSRQSYEVADSLSPGKKSDVQAWVPDSELWADRIAAGSDAIQVSKAGNAGYSPTGATPRDDQVKPGAAAIMEAGSRG